MKGHILATAAAALLCTTLITGGNAASTVEPVQVSKVTLEFGSRASRPVVSPKRMMLERNKTYTLTVNNFSELTHFIEPGLFNGAVRTFSLEVDGGKVTGYNPANSPHLKISRIDRMELRPGGTITWKFMPRAATRSWPCFNQSTGPSR